MTRLQSRFRGVVLRYGETVGGGTGVVVPLGYAKARDYLADDELSAAPRPMWLATVGYDHPAAEGDTVAWRTRSLLVKRAVDVRFAGATVARLLVLLATTGTSGGGPGTGTPPEST